MTRELVFTVGRDEFTIQTFRSGGKGGQNQNKRSTGVRIIHTKSGARGESREHRSQLANRRAAFERLVRTAAWRVWLAAELYRRTAEETPEEKVARWMDESRLRVEKREGGIWRPW